LLSPIFSDADDDILTSEDIELLNHLHRQKIRMCNGAYVINVEGCIGESARHEIEYAESIGKPAHDLTPIDL